jgi:predicted AlkP superfamily pyrophosphatase or phosphodiesterase
MYGHYLFISTLLALGARAHNGGHKEGGKQHLSFKHVAVFSVDGLHNSDIDKYLTKGKSNISMMLDNGYRYTNAYSTFPSDSFPGTLALFTGAFPVQSGVWYDDVWDRSLYPPGSKCSGAAGAEGRTGN